MSWGWGMGMGGGMGGMGGMRGGMRGALAMSDEDLGKVFDWGLIRRLLGYVRPYKKHAGMGILAMMVYQGTYIAQPYIPTLAFKEIQNGNSKRAFHRRRNLLRDGSPGLDGAISAGLSHDLRRPVRAVRHRLRHVPPRLRPLDVVLRQQ